MSIGNPPFGPALLGAEEARPLPLIPWLRPDNAPFAPVPYSLLGPALIWALSFSCSDVQVLPAYYRKIFLLTGRTVRIYLSNVRRPACTPISSGTQPRYPHQSVGSGVSLLPWRCFVARMLSIVASIIRGSVGGLTYTANQFHQIIVRARTAPVNPNTTNQTTIRSAFNVASQAWKVMIPTVRAAWNEYADSLTYEGPLGPYTMPGRQVCIGNLALAGYIATRELYALVPSAAAPVTPGFLDVGNITVGNPAAGNTGFTISVNNPNLFDVVIFAQRSIPFNVSRERFKGPYLSDTDLAQAVVAETTAPIPFYGLEEGLVYFAHLRAITEEGPYRISTDYYVRAIAVTVELPNGAKLPKSKKKKK